MQNKFKESQAKLSNDVTHILSDDDTVSCDFQQESIV